MYLAGWVERVNVSFCDMLKFQNIFKTQIECILLSGLNERVTKADAAVICEFHEGWLVDMDEGRGDHISIIIIIIVKIILIMMTLKMMAMMIMLQVLRRTT